MIRLVLPLFLAACTGAPATPAGPASAPTTTPEPVDQVPVDHSAAYKAVHDPARPEADREKDADRKPLATLELLELEPGETVADLMGGRGYSTELLARTVGTTGKVYVQNNAFVLEKFAEKDLSARLERLGPEGYQVERLDREIDDPGLPAGALDAAFLGLFYHDSVWMEADREKMNRAVYEALKPGGVYVVTDHYAEDGSGTRDVKTLHRIDREVVVKELAAAGFELEEESHHLRHTDDDRTLNVFDDAIRGKTDRFVLKLRKPAN